MVCHWEDLGLPVKVRDRGHFVAPSGNAEGSILYGLEFSYGRRGGVGEPDGCGVGNDGIDQRFVCCDYGLPLLAPSGASEGFEDIQSIASPLTYCLYVRGESVVGVESNPQDFGGPT